MAAAGIKPNVAITDNIRGVSFASALRLMLRKVGLTYVAEDDYILITAPGKVTPADAPKAETGGNSSSNAGPEDRPAAPPHVSVAHPIARDVTDYEDFAGYIQAAQTAEIRARVTGNLEKVFFKPGQLVKKGEVLFEIDSRLYQAELDQAAGGVQQVQIRLDAEGGARSRAGGGKEQGRQPRASRSDQKPVRRGCRRRANGRSRRKSRPAPPRFHADYRSLRRPDRPLTGGRGQPRDGRKVGLGHACLNRPDVRLLRRRSADRAGHPPPHGEAWHDDFAGGRLRPARRGRVSPSQHGRFRGGQRGTNHPHRSPAGGAAEQGRTAAARHVRPRAARRHRAAQGLSCRRCRWGPIKDIRTSWFWPARMPPSIAKWWPANS